MSSTPTRPATSCRQASVHAQPTSIRPAARALPALLCTALASLILPCAAQAASFCVNNGDALFNAMEAAQENNESDVIRITSGRMFTFFNGAGFPSWDYDYSATGLGLSISGGWNSNCNEQSLDPTLTVLDGRNTESVMRINNVSNAGRSVSAQITLSNLTLANGRASPNQPYAALLAHMVPGLPGDTLLIENVIFTGGTSDPDLGIASPSVVNVAMSQGTSIRFRNNVVYANNISEAPFGQTLRVVADLNSIALISNNSVFGNVTASNTGGGAVVFGTATLHNNVFAENSSTFAQGTMQLYSSANGVSLINNHIPSIFFATGGPAVNIGTTTGPAMWSGTGPFRVPDAGSPLRDSGTNAPLGGLPTTDVRGLARIQNSVIDRGAVEAQPPANTGPIITGLDPVAGSTTVLPATSTTTRTAQVFFFTQSGNGTGQTTMECGRAAGSLVVTVRPVQTVSNGGRALPVEFAMDNPVPGGGNVQATLVCTVSRENANTSTLTFNFVINDPVLFSNGFE